MSDPNVTKAPVGAVARLPARTAARAACAAALLAALAATAANAAADSAGPAPANGNPPATAPQAGAPSRDTVRLRGGDIVEGRVADEGDRLRVETDHGVVSVRWRDVDAVLPGRTAASIFAERRASVKDGDAPGLYALALWARKAGLDGDARACLEAAVRADPEHAAARDALSQQKKDGSWLGGSDLLAAKGFVGRDGAWLLREEAEALDRRAAEQDLTPDEKTVEDLVSRAATGPAAAKKFALESLERLPPASFGRPALRALRRGRTATERELGARLLGRIRDDADVFRPLILSSVLDRDPTVRSAAVESLAGLGNPAVVKPIARSLWSSLPEVRMNAAEALGGFAAFPEAAAQSVEYILRRVMTSGGPGGRNHIFVGSEITYVSDFDVEIAQAAQIGDPVVGKIREGTLLDCRVLSVREEWTEVERRVAFRSLRLLTGKDYGEDAAAWSGWWEKGGRAAMTAVASSGASPK
ncbi:MAG: hypothetical protein HMLKMBBP_00663 [Planctomycetes bacterium]|nr:hypothetical protein [Planctomycetota bacterium]